MQQVEVFSKSMVQRSNQPMKIYLLSLCLTVKTETTHDKVIEIGDEKLFWLQ